MTDPVPPSETGTARSASDGQAGPATPEGTEEATGAGEGAGSPGDAARGAHSPLLVLRNPRYALLAGTNLLSVFGTFFASIASVLLIDELSGHSSFYTGLVVVADFAPNLVFAPLVGWVADTFDRRRVVMTCQTGMVLVAGLLALLSGTGLLTIWRLLACNLLIGTLGAFTFPPLKAMLPVIVGPEELGDALAIDSATFNLGRALGPVGGALVYSRLGPTAAFAMNAVSFLFILAAVAAVGIRGRPLKQGRASLWRSFVELVGKPVPAVCLGTIAAVAIAADPPTSLGPAIARAFGHPEAFAGVILGAAGVGAVLAAFTVSPSRRAPLRRLTTGLGIMLAGVLLYTVQPWVVPALIGLALAGFGYLMSQTQANTLLLSTAPDHARGRISTLYTVAFLGSRPLAGLIDGTLTDVTGNYRVAAWAVAGFALAALLAVLVLRRRGETGALID